MSKLRLFRPYYGCLPTIWGWLLLFFVSIFLLNFVRHNIYSFLAPIDSGDSDILVVEGWMPTFELDQAVEFIKARGYKKIITTGGPILGWIEMKENSTYARLATDYLIQHGVSRNKIITVSSPDSAQERTYLNAVMLREATHRLGISFEKIDLFSSGVHARRSRLLYQMAFDSKINVNVVAARPRNYNPDAWWQTSSGTESVIVQTVGILWVKCCFWPRPYDSKKELLGINSILEIQ